MANRAGRRLLLCGWLGSAAAAAQPPPARLVYFTDKDATPYSLSRPADFLSPRALARRARQQIDLTPLDLPVDPAYVARLTAAGARVEATSRWFNAAVVRAPDEVMDRLLALPCVRGDQRLTLIAPARQPTGSYATATATAGHDAGHDAGSTNNLGASDHQLRMLGADQMHARGYLGQGMWVAVFDAGFPGVDQLPAFAHLFDQRSDNGTLRGTYDFVNRTPRVYGFDGHGTGVLSCLAAYQPDVLTGTAPYADYFLFRTEDATGERTIEEVYWLLAAERADSLGVDVISASLGYAYFDTPAMSYQPQQMDGVTTIVSRAAGLAAATGMLVVASAGNEGNDVSWRGTFTAPADADAVLTVGAVFADSTYTSFSSRGPTADGRTKPDLVAQGGGTAVLTASGRVVRGNGTSYAAPLLGGLATGLWQAYPWLTRAALADVLRQTAHRAQWPGPLYGWGIPNFGRAADTLSRRPSSSSGTVRLYPTLLRNGDPLWVEVSAELLGTHWQATLHDVLGRQVAATRLHTFWRRHALAIDTHTLQPGLYVLRLSGGPRQAYAFRFVKQ